MFVFWLYTRTESINKMTTGDMFLPPTKAQNWETSVECRLGLRCSNASFHPPLIRWFDPTQETNQAQSPKGPWVLELMQQWKDPKAPSGWLAVLVKWLEQKVVKWRENLAILHSRELGRMKLIHICGHRISYVPRTNKIQSPEMPRSWYWERAHATNIEKLERSFGP